MVYRGASQAQTSLCAVLCSAATGLLLESKTMISLTCRQVTSCSSHRARVIICNSRAIFLQCAAVHHAL